MRNTEKQREKDKSENCFFLFPFFLLHSEDIGFLFILGFPDALNVVIYRSFCILRHRKQICLSVGFVEGSEKIKLEALIYRELKFSEPLISRNHRGKLALFFRKT